LIQKTEEFQRGYLTMDQSSRLVPLEPSDPMVLKYPIIGIWVKAIPQTNSSCRSVSLVHPLVWAACIQFILNKDFREKASPSPSTCTFLLLDFSEKLKVFEVNSQKPPAWKTTSFSAEIDSTSINPEKTSPLSVQFLKKDTRFLLKNIVGTYAVHSTSNSRSGTPPTSKTPGHKIQRTSGSAKEMIRTRSYDKIINEQTKLIEKLQVKVQKLQQQVSPKSKSHEFQDLHSPATRRSAQNAEVDFGKVKKKIDFDVEEGVQENRNVVYSSQKIVKPMAFHPAFAAGYGRSSMEEEKVAILKRIHVHRKK
jgi:hypothetical protein